MALCVRIGGWDVDFGVMMELGEGDDFVHGLVGIYLIKSRFGRFWFNPRATISSVSSA